MSLLEPPLSPQAWLRWDVVQRLLPAEVRTVLEIGCGQGAVGARLAQRYEYLGVEPDASSCATARSRVEPSGGKVVNGSLEVLPDGVTFDLVCAFEVLEHIEDDVTAIRAWWERVRPGGWLLLSTPAFQDRYDADDAAVGHFRRYEPDALAALARSAGFATTQAVVYGAPLGFALQAARVAVVKRRSHHEAPPESPGSSGQLPGTMQERTSGSGRWLQPRTAVAGWAARAGTKPFRVLQRAFPHAGTGVVLLAQRPLEAKLRV